jgi:hypothetical protein
VAVRIYLEYLLPTSERTSEKTSERTSERTSEKTSEKTSERTSEKTSERTSEKTLARFYQSPTELPTAKLSIVLVQSVDFSGYFFHK